jgi:hypothetical protein
VSFGIDGRRLDLWHLIYEEIDQQLTQGNADGVAETQPGFAHRLTTIKTEQADNALFAATSDGSILALTLE